MNMGDAAEVEPVGGIVTGFNPPAVERTARADCQQADSPNFSEGWLCDVEDGGEDAASDCSNRGPFQIAPRPCSRERAARAKRVPPTVCERFTAALAPFDHMPPCRTQARVRNGSGARIGVTPETGPWTPRQRPNGAKSFQGREQKLAPRRQPDLRPDRTSRRQLLLGGANV